MDTDTDQRTENLKNLLSMFPDVDSEICEAVLASNDNDLETSINTLLSITDPSYVPPEPPTTTITTQTPSQPQSQTPLSTKRTTTTSLPPSSSPFDQRATTAESRVFVTKEEQIRRDEELAKRLAAEDQIEYVEEHRSTQQHRRQQQQQQEEDQSSPFPDFSEELPVIKEKIVQAADTTKKKVKEWYEKFKQQSVALRNEYGYDNDNNNNNQNQNQNSQYSSLPHDESDNTLLSEDFTTSLDNKNNRHQNLSSFTTDSKSNNYNNKSNIYNNDNKGNYSNKINSDDNLRSSPLRSQQPVYGSYEIDLDNKKDSYSPFNIIEKDNDLITTSSSNIKNNNNNNLKTDSISTPKNNQQKSTTDFPPYSIFVKENDDDEKEKEKEESNGKGLDTAFSEKLNITTTKSPSTSSSSTNNATTSSNDSNENKSSSSNTGVEDIKKDFEV